MIDYFAIAITGYYPTPTPTDTQRMAFVASWGYLSSDPTPPEGASFLNNMLRVGTGSIRFLGNLLRV